LTVHRILQEGNSLKSWSIFRQTITHFTVIIQKFLGYLPTAQYGGGRGAHTLLVYEVEIVREKAWIYQVYQAMHSMRNVAHEEWLCTFTK
jgi:hypothetical protein